MVTRSVLHVGPGGPGVPPHTHDGSEIEGTADLIHLRVDQLLAGTITGKEVILAGGAAGVIRSDNFVSGVDGWAIFGDGSAELNAVVVRGTIVAGTGSEVDWSYIKNVSIENADIVSLEFDKITAGSNDASLVIGASGSISSANYAAGTSGFIIAGSGDAEFNDVTVRGAVIAGSGSSIDWGYIDNVSIGSADITDLSFDKITAATNTASLVVGGAGVIKSANYVAGSTGWQIEGDGDAEFNDVVIRGDLVSGNWNGADPVDLSSRDTTATTGYALDSVAGAAQFMGDMFVGGSIHLFGSTSNNRILVGSAQQVMLTAPGGFGAIYFGEGLTSSLNNAGGVWSTSSAQLDIESPANASGNYRAGITLSETNAGIGMEAKMTVQLTRRSGSPDRQNVLDLYGNRAILYTNGAIHARTLKPTANHNEWQVVSPVGQINQVLQLGSYWESGVGQEAYIQSYDYGSNVVRGLRLSAAEVTLDNIGTTANNTLPSWRHANTGAPYALLPLVSSERFKIMDSEVPATGHLIDQLVRYPVKRWKDKADPDGPWIYGITAEDAYEVAPESVVVDEDGLPLSFDPANALAIPLLVAVRDLLGRLEAAEARIAAMEEAA